MDELIKQHWRSAERITQVEARSWNIPECDHEDILQATLAEVVKYWKPDKIKDPEAYYLSAVYMTARTVVIRLAGYHRGNKHPQAAKAKGEQATFATGLYQSSSEEGTDVLLDERILPTVPSAEDVYMATVPSKRQEALRGAIESLAPRQREAVSLRFYEELSLDEVAAQMGLSPSQVSQAISTGLRVLKARLNGESVAPSVRKAPATPKGTPNNKKTECPAGHPYDIVKPSGARRCSTCKNKSNRESKARQALKVKLNA